MSAITAKALNDTLGTADFRGINYYLERIADAIGAQYTYDTWADIKKAVKFGLAEKAFPIGTQIEIEHDDYTRTWEVVAHDHFKIPNSPNAHTMTLMPTQTLLNWSFGGRQAFFYANTALEAGQYNFTVADGNTIIPTGTYSFTLTLGVPQGGQMDFEILSAGFNVRTYSNAYTDTELEAVPAFLSSAGTNLGTLGTGYLNTLNRALYGSDNYKSSPIRQWLNSDATEFQTNPVSIFDRRQVWSGASGFLKGFDSDFLEAITPVEVACATNDYYEPNADSVRKSTKYTLTDKVFLASSAELSVQGGVADDSTVLARFKNADRTARIRTDEYGVATTYFTRSASNNIANKASRVIYINAMGSKYDINATESAGIIPLINIG